MAPQHSISQFKLVASAPQPTAAGAGAKSERRLSSEGIRIKNSLEAPGRAHLAQRFNAALRSKSDPSVFPDFGCREWPRESLLDIDKSIIDHLYLVEFVMTS